MMIEENRQPSSTLLLQRPPKPSGSECMTHSSPQNLARQYPLSNLLGCSAPPSLWGRARKIMRKMWSLGKQREPKSILILRLATPSASIDSVLSSVFGPRRGGTRYQPAAF